MSTNETILSHSFFASLNSSSGPKSNRVLKPPKVGILAVVHASSQYGAFESGYVVCLLQCVRTRQRATQRGAMCLGTDSSLLRVILAFPFDYIYPHSCQFAQLLAPPLRSYISMRGLDSLLEQFALFRVRTDLQALLRQTSAPSTIMELRLHWWVTSGFSLFQHDMKSCIDCFVAFSNTDDAMDGA